MVTKNTQLSNNREVQAKTYISYKKIESPVKSFLLGVGITNASKDSILEFIINFIKKSAKNCYIVTPNPEIITHASKSSSFKDVLNSAEVALCDGVGVVIACKMLGIPMKERFTGIEAVESICQQANDLPIKVGFLGGRGGVAELTAKCLQKKYPKLRVSYVGEEWDANTIKDLRLKNKESREIINHKSLIVNHSIDILFVAFGFPKQEEWMAEHIHKIPARVMVGVGGAFDYISGNVPRAPQFVRTIGFEWLFRLIVQPWRIKRQLALVEFMYLVMKERFKKNLKS